MLSLNNPNNLYRRGSALHLVRFAWLPKLFGTGSGCPQSASSVWFALFLAMPFRPSFSSSPFMFSSFVAIPAPPRSSFSLLE